MRSASRARSLARSLLALTLVCAFAVPTPLATAAPAAKTPAAHSAAGPPVDQATNILVKFKPGTSRQDARSAGLEVGFRVVREIPRIGWTVLRATSATPEQVVLGVRALGLADKVELDAQAELAVAPNDPYYFTQWGFANTGQTGGTPGADISAPAAWDVSTGSSAVVVAVVDTGAHLDHPDLAGNAWVNTAEIANNGIDDDSNGYVDDVNGWDFNHRDSTPWDTIDEDKHGTHVAGTIGAVGDNALGVTGVNWDVSIMSLKFISPSSGSVSSGAEAIVYAVDNGASVINHSWTTTSYSDVLEDAILYARTHGVINVCAAGNATRNLDSIVTEYPGALEATNVVTVAATDSDDKLASFSNYSVNYVDIAAPGVEITSTVPIYDSAFHINATPYEIVYFGFPMETSIQEPARQSVIAWSMNELAPDLDTPVLVVDDSHRVATGDPFDRLNTYLVGLSTAGYTDVSVWNTEVSGAPAAVDLAGHVVVWFTGMTHGMPGPIGSLDAAERTALGTYLDSGGRLAISSGAVGGDLDYLGAASAWFQSYFHVACVDFESWTRLGQGSAGGPFDGVSYEISEDDYYLGWPADSDDLMALDSAATPLMEWDGYAQISGTSMASPHVAGALALMAAAHPDESMYDARVRLESTVETLSVLAGKVRTGGRLDIGAAIADYAAPPVVLTPLEGATLGKGTTARIDFTPRSGTAAGATYEAQVSTPVEYVSNGSFESGNFTDWTSATGWTASDAVEDVYSGNWGARSRLNQPNSTSSSISRNVTVPTGGAWLSFKYWLDSEDYYDYAYLRVRYNTGTLSYRWIGERDAEWETVRVWLPAGTHTLYFVYEKDGSVAEGRDAFGVDEISIATETWGPAGTAGSASSEITFTVPDLLTRSGAVRVRSLAGTTPGAWETVRFLTYTDDTVPPAAPSGLSAVPDTDGGVALSWTDPLDPDFAYTRITRSTLTTPTTPDDGTLVYQGAAQAVADTGLLNGQTAYYAAFSRDGSANWSAAATTATPVIDTTPPPPVGLFQISRNANDIDLTWMNPISADFDRTRVVRRAGIAPTGPFDPLATLIYQGTALATSDLGVFAEETETVLFYSAYALDRSDNASTAATRSIVVDTLAPAGTFVLEGGAVSVDYTTLSADSVVTGATEMRFDSGSGYGTWSAYANTSSVTIPAVVGTHTVVAQYRDAAGNVLELSDSILFDDTVPPAAPSGLSAVPDTDGGVALSWTDPLDPDFAYTRITRSTVSTPTTPDEGTLVYQGAAQVAADTGLLHGQTAYYAAFARDGSANWSAAATTATPVIDTTPPSPVGLFQISRNGNDIDLTWMNPISADFDRTRIVRRAGTAPAGPFDPLAMLTYEGTGLATSDLGVFAEETETVLFYSAYALDRSDNASTAATRSIVVDTLAPAGTFVLEGGAVSVDYTTLSADSVVTGATEMRFDSGSGYGTWSAYANTSSVTIPALTGSRTVWAQYRDDAGNVLELSDSILVDLVVPTSERVASTDRYATALAVSRSTFASATVAIVATGEGYADALGASALAGAHHAPVLLTGRDKLPAGLLGELDRLGVERVIVVGGTAAVSRTVYDALDSAGYFMRRIAGADRYATAASLAAETHAVRTAPALADTVFIARGDEFADALAVAPVAYSGQMPVLLVTPGGVPAATAFAIKARGYTHAVVLGGVNAIPASVAGALGVPYERVSGLDRYGTAAAVAAWGSAESISSYRTVAVATGLGFADALSGGAATGEQGGVLLLTAPSALSNPTRSAVQAHSSEIKLLRILGGTSAVSAGVKSQLDALLPD